MSVSLKSAIQSLAPLKLAPLRLAPVKLARLSLALVKLALVRLAPQSKAPLRLASLRTPLMCAVSSGNIEVVKLLVEVGADVNTIRGGGNFALMIAAEAGYREIFEYLTPLTNSILRQEAEKVFG